MDIKTRDFGNIKADEEDIIRFTEGIYGFEEYKEYVILKDDPNDDIMYLQSVNNEELSFVLIDPYSIVQFFKPTLNEEDLAMLKVQHETELKYLVIAIICKDLHDSVANLKSPIAINPELKIAKQVILQNLEYPLRYSIFSAEGEDKC